MKNQQIDSLFREHVQKYQMIFEQDAVIAGVSGGSDSMVMLDLLRNYRKEKSFELYVVHVHHGIRGKEADKDAAFVEAKCMEWEIPCRIVQADVPYLAAKWRTGLEETGRMVRRNAFQIEKERIRRQYPGKKIRIALAHHAEDRSETVLWNLIRGSGLAGVSSMREVAGDVIRPILFLTKTEILEYLQEENIPFQEDATNAEDIYTRNRLRHQVLPVLQQMNPRAVFHINETAELLAEASDYFESRAEEILEQCRQSSDGYLLGPEVSGEHPAISKKVIHLAMQRLARQGKDIEKKHVLEVLDLAGKQNGKQVSLPYMLFAEQTSKGIYLGKRKTSEKQVDAVPLKIPGRTILREGYLDCEILPYEGQKILEKKYTKWMDYDTITTGLCVRTRAENDVMIVRGDGMQKKLNRVLIDDKIPRWERDRIALIAADNEILWITGHRMSERTKVTEKTKKILKIHYQEGSFHEERKD